MSLTFEILNALAKAEGREAILTTVKAWIAIQEGVAFLEANPGLAFGNEGAKAHVLPQEPTQEEKVLDGLATLAEAVALVALTET